MLEQIWWRLDAALDLPMLEWSAKLGALEALEAGCTAIIDHHESPTAIDGSLTVIADACAEVGVRVITCYGVTDRHGADGARRGLEENDRFLGEGGRGMVGVHAAFTCTDDTLHAAAELAAHHGVGVHIHVAEGPDDADAASRLAGLNTDDWLLIHGVHLADRSRSAGHHRPQPTVEPEQLGRLRQADAVSESRGARYRRHRRRHDRRVPARLRRGPVRRRDRRSGHRVVMARARVGAVSRRAGRRVTWSYRPMEPWRLAYTPTVRAIDVDIDGEAALRDGVATRVDADEIRTEPPNRPPDCTLCSDCDERTARRPVHWLIANRGHVERAQRPVHSVMATGCESDDDDGGADLGEVPQERGVGVGLALAAARQAGAEFGLGLVGGVVGSRAAGWRGSRCAPMSVLSHRTI